MNNQIEVLTGLERRLRLSVSTSAIQAQTRARLVQLARSLKMPGFRPGKVPLKMVEQSHGQQVSSELLGEAVSKALTSAITEHNLKVAGEPRIDGVMSTGEESSTDELQFDATFEVYPEVQLQSLADKTFSRFVSPVGEAEVDRTIETLRKQRMQWAATERAAADADRVTIDFRGTLDDVEFAGGSAENFPFVLGEGRMLADFEQGIRGATAGETRIISVHFPSGYQNAELADKTAQFSITVRQVEAPVLPDLDSDFAKALGVADGDLARMRADVRTNLEREVSQRLRTRTKTAALDELATMAQFELPKALVAAETARMVENAKQEFKQRGMDVENLPIPPEAFAEQAQKRVRLGLIVGEVVRTHGLTAKPDQIRRQIEEFAQAYEDPGELIRWYYSDRTRLADVEALVIEQNVVDWVLAQGTTAESPLGFDELMTNNA